MEDRGGTKEKKVAMGVEELGSSKSARLSPYLLAASDPRGGIIAWSVDLDRLKGAGREERGAPKAAEAAEERGPG